MPDLGFLVVRRQGFEGSDPLIKSQPLRAATGSALGEWRGHVRRAARG